MLRPCPAELTQRRQRLQHRIAQQRTILAADVKGLLPVASAIDTGRNTVQWVRNHPELSLAAVAAIVVLKPRFAFRWGKRGLLLWQTWRRLRKLAPR